MNDGLATPAALTPIIFTLTNTEDGQLHSNPIMLLVHKEVWAAALGSPDPMHTELCGSAVKKIKSKISTENSVIEVVMAQAMTSGTLHPYTESLSHSCGCGAVTKQSGPKAKCSFPPSLLPLPFW